MQKTNPEIFEDATWQFVRDVRDAALAGDCKAVTRRCYLFELMYLEGGVDDQPRDTNHTEDDFS